MDEMMQLGDLTKIATYEEFDRAFENESRRVSQGFIRMGYLLRRARDTDILYNSGYKSIAEYAEKKYGFKPDYVSNLIKVNEKYSESGYSDRIQERYGKWGFSLLVELADLPEAIAEEIPDGTKREEIREVKREVKAEEKITPIETILEEETRVTRMWGSILSKFLVQYFHSNPESFPEAWRTMRKVSTGTKEIGRAVMDILAPSGICTKMARIQGVGKYMLSIKDETTPPVLVDVRLGLKEPVGWDDLQQTMDRIFNNPLDSTYQDTWRELYGEPMGGENDEGSIPERKDKNPVCEESKPGMEESESERQPEPPRALEDDQPRMVEAVQTDNAEDTGYREGVEDEKPDGGKTGEKVRGFETEEIAPAQNETREPKGEPRQTTVEDFPEMLPEGYVPEPVTDQTTALWDRARALAEGIQGWMTEHSYGVGRGTKAGLDDIMNAASELQEVALELKHHL